MNGQEHISLEPDRDLVHDAWLEVNSDPDNYSSFQMELVEDLEYRFKKGEQKTLSVRQKIQLRKILFEE